MGHKLLEVAFTVLRKKQPYRDPQIDYESLVVKRNAPRWIAALQKYGYLPGTQMPLSRKERPHLGPKARLVRRDQKEDQAAMG